MSTADLVGNDRAIAAAVRGLGDAGGGRGAPALQPAALSHDLRAGKRKERKERNKQIAALRDADGGRGRAPRRRRSSSSTG